jgi:hypothetical protein
MQGDDGGEAIGVAQSRGDDDTCGRVLRADRREDVDSVAVGEHDVEDDDVGPLRCAGDSRGDRIDVIDVVSDASQDHAHRFRGRGIILDEEHRFFRRFSRRGSSRRR